MKLVIKNLRSYIMTLSPKAKERLARVQNNLPEPIPSKKLLIKPCFIAYGMMILGSIPPLSTIIRKSQAPTHCETPPSVF